MKPQHFLLPLLFLLPAASLAHGPTPQKADESIAIDAPVETVWAAIAQFDRIGDWHPDVAKSSGDGVNATGGTRTLTLQNGQTLEESLDHYDAAQHEYRYRLKSPNTQALPVSSYSTTLMLTEGDNGQGSVLRWKSRFYRGDTSNEPPESLNDAAAVKEMQGFFKNGLAGLKRQLEK